MDKPNYPHRPIGSINTLAIALGTTEKKLVSIANQAETSYKEFEINDGSRTVFDPKFELKKIQKRINRRVFEEVVFPNYLQGGLRCSDKRDYVENARIHAHSTTLISLDIKKFFNNVKSKYVYDIYKHFFKFPNEVCEILTKLTTLRGALPQGACTSTYLANLVFFNSEYHLVSFFRGKNVKYSRLLDDITLSSDQNLSEETRTKYILKVNALFKKFELKLNNSKTKVEYKNTPNNDFKVTGLWIEHKKPKLRKNERRHIRQLVFEVEKAYKEDKTAKSYHELWNRVSGNVAKMNRLKHQQSDKLRERLADVLPEYGQDEIRKIKIVNNKLLEIPKVKHCKIGVIKQYNKQIHRLGILGRTNRNLARRLRVELKAYYADVLTKEKFWHE